MSMLLTYLYYNYIDAHSEYHSHIDNYNRKNSSTHRHTITM